MLRSQLVPLSQRSRAVLLEDMAPVEMTLAIEEVVDRRVNGGESKSGIADLASSEGRMMTRSALLSSLIVPRNLLGF